MQHENKWDLGNAGNPSPTRPWCGLQWDPWEVQPSQRAVEKCDTMTAALQSGHLILKKQLCVSGMLFMKSVT